MKRRAIPGPLIEVSGPATPARTRRPATWHPIRP